MAEWTAVTVQTVNPGESIVFTENPVPCNLGLILHRDDSGAFLMKGVSSQSYCPCRRNSVVNYMADFGANIAIPTGQTVGPISVALAVDGNTLGGTTMVVTPAAVEEFFNVSCAVNVPIWLGCCQTLSIRNTSEIPILVESANLVLSK